MQEKELILFIGEWDKINGVKVLEHYPTQIPNFDLEHLAWKIFLFFENFYLSEESKKYKKTIFQLPIKEKGKFGSVLIDTLPSERSRDKKVPYIIALLLPEYFPREQIKDFDNQLKLLNQKFRKERTLHLNDYFDKIFNKFSLKQKVIESEIFLNPDYSGQEALTDFKKGLRLFSENAYKISYMIIKKSYLQFKKENSVKLILEATYFIATILTKLKRFNVAMDYYDELRQLAKKLKHRKYYEISIFMSAFCAYKINDYSLALNLYKELEKYDLEFIDVFDMFYFYGRVLRLLNKYNKSIQKFSKCIENIEHSNISDKKRKKLAKVYFELGHSSYLSISEKMLKRGSKTKYASELKQVINTYKKANDILEEFNDYSTLIISLQMIGNFYEYLGKRLEAITFYRKAIKYTEENNDVMSRMKLFDLIINNLMDLGKDQQLVKEIDQMLYEIKTYAFLNLSTVAKYHTKLGKSYVRLDHFKEGLSEFLIALNIYERFDYPKQEVLEILKNIISIYSKKNDLKYLSYYKQKLDEYQQKVVEYEEKRSKLRIFELVKDIWILKDGGEEIFSYAPESKSNPQLLSGFLSATLNFSFEMTSEQLNAIKLGFDQYLLYGEPQKPYIIVGRASINQSEKQIRNILKRIFDKFGDTYGSILETNTYEHSTFTGFIETLKNL